MYFYEKEERRRRNCLLALLGRKGSKLYSIYPIRIIRLLRIWNYFRDDGCSERKKKFNIVFDIVIGIVICLLLWAGRKRDKHDILLERALIWIWFDFIAIDFWRAGMWGIILVPVSSNGRESIESLISRSSDEMLALELSESSGIGVWH